MAANAGLGGQRRQGIGEADAEALAAARTPLRACCLSLGEVATPILNQRPVVHSEQEKAKILHPEDLGRTIRFCRKPAAAGLRQRNPDQPDLEPGFIQTPANRD